jgi:tetratricopeptide (TPR) repeat protein
MNRFVIHSGLAMVLAAGLMAQPKPKSQPELDALRAMFAATTPDERIKTCEEVLTKFPNTEFKATALYFEGISYEQKGDYEHTIVFGERAVEADPKHYQAMIMLAGDIAQHTKEFDLDREEKLAQVEKYAKSAMELAKDAPKPNPNLTDDQWAEAKKDFISQAHAALGMGAMARKKPDAAEAEFKLSIEGVEKPDPANMVRLGRAYAEDKKYDEAIAQFDKVMAMSDVTVQIKQIAQAERVRAIQKKGGPTPAAPPASGAAPPANPTPPAGPTAKP